MEFYPEIRLVHIYAVAASGALFLLRGLGLLRRARWAAGSELRYLGLTIDTVLLTAALMLTTILDLYPFVEPWVTVKLVLFVVYVVLGVIAFQEGPQNRRVACWAGGLVAFAFAATVAVAHHPLGFLAMIG